VLWRKLTALILACVIGLFAFGGTVAYQFKKLSDGQALLTNNLLPSYSVLAQCQADYIRLLGILRDTLGTGLSPQDEEKITALERQIQQQLLNYQFKLVFNDEDQNLISLGRAAFSTSQTIINDVLALSAQGRHADADTLRQRKIGELLYFVSVISQHMELNDRLVREHTVQLNKIRDAAMRTGAVIGLAILALIFAMAWMVLNSVMRPLRDFRISIVRLAHGDLDSDIAGLSRNDEVGQSGRALEALRLALLQARAREGNKDAVVTIVEQLQGQTDHRRFAEKAVAAIARATGAEHVALYLADADKHRLQRLASTGGRACDVDCDSIAWGSGIVGLAADQARLISRKTGSDEMALLPTGTGELPLPHVSAMPILQRNRVVAVIEVSSLDAADERRNALLEALADPLGLLMEILDRNAETLEMLELSRKQGTVLEAQRMELETRQATLVALNDDLIAKGSQLAEARDEAESAARAKANFLANMSHEIRTPMNAIIGMAHLALGPVEDKERRGHVEKILRAGKHLLGVLNDILDFSKIDAAALKLESANFRLRGVIEQAYEMFMPRCAEKRLTLSVEIAKGTPEYCRGDALRLGQILINLLGNGVKFTEAGSITIRVQPEAGDPERLRFEVADTGIGITDAQRNNLFESFQQADTSTTRRFGGTGLGLAISKRLTELMDGEIGVDSTPGFGSTFWFTARLPTVKPSLEQMTASTAESADIEGVRILLVEDDAMNQTVATGLLRAAGAEITVAGNGREAVDRARALDAGHDFDIVLMDMHMPVMGGIEAAGTLRTIAGWEQIPILAMTASCSPDKRIECATAGMNGYITKPVEPGDLYAAISGALNRASDPLLAIEGLDARRGIQRVLGRRDAYADLLQNFKVAQRGTPKKIAQAIDNEDLTLAERLAHTLKGLCGTIGAMALADRTRNVEHALRNQDASQARVAVADLQHELGALLDRIEHALPRNTPAVNAHAQVDAAQTDGVLQQLETLLAAGEADAREVAERNADLLRLSLGDTGRRMYDAIMAFRLEDAFEMLSALRAEIGPKTLITA
jgi:signal transduction histidine kinase/CheY-like chemotaxis protein/HPt (histidine-containing phosphotransfer) domain-containing protein/HAMP domain-containing protein